jgi:hypothetical protein
MGLDAKIMIEVLYGCGRGDVWEQHPREGGFLTYKTQLVIAEEFKHSYIHGFMCEHNSEAHECRSIELDKEELLRLEVLLKSWVKDPEAFKPCPKRFWGAFFGPRPDEEGFEKHRDCLRKEATALAKKIRKGRLYIEKMNKKYDHAYNKPWYYAVYRASW